MRLNAVLVSRPKYKPLRWSAVRNIHQFRHRFDHKINIQKSLNGQTRGIRKDSTLRPVIQGALPRDEAAISLENDEGPTYPTVMQQALNNMRKFSHCVLLTRVGSFYEVSLRPINTTQLTAVSSIFTRLKNTHLF
jgi:hypothetical protein